MLYIEYLILVSGRNIKRISFGNFHFLPAGVENYISRLCPSPLGTPPPPPRKKKPQIG